jgi:phage FluMu gp28-like protein
MNELVPSVWFSSADLSAAAEYIDYCKKWSELFNYAAKEVGNEIIAKETVYFLTYANGTKITALSSNPKAFRSKGGKVVLDEFAFHENAHQMWKAARPTITWGFPLRILSTHNGQSCKYYEFIQDVKAGKLPWSLHVMNIFRAVQEGLVDKIYKRPTTEAERQEWLDNEKASCGDEQTWLQEFCCIPVDESTAFITYDLIKACEDDNCGVILRATSTPDEIMQPLELLLNSMQGQFFFGVDIGREKDLSVIWVLQKEGSHKFTRILVELAKMPYSEQKYVIDTMMKKLNPYRTCFDATGIGDNLAEDFQRAYGQYRVEKVKFTGPVKEAMATDFKLEFEDRKIIIPYDELLRNDLHSIRKVTTSAGNVRFDVARNQKESHADRFWAGALANHAITKDPGPVVDSVTSRGKRQSDELTRGF